ncbi:MAG TPA: HigA family addiction module antitoxin [Candidatus Polarisedimenticolaceae bacterium]|nr:HigA family addiction module antitoxin [Candidatus Polarisedimenticolaceae bacterium]
MKMKRKPTSPGEILSEEFLGPLGITQVGLAKHIGCDVKVINRIVNGRTSVTAEMAIRLGAALRMTPEFWLNAQQAVDIYEAVRRVKRVPAPYPLAG